MLKIKMNTFKRFKKLKPWIKYLISTIITFCLIVLIGYENRLISEEWGSTYQMNFNRVAINVIIGTLIGVIIGLEHFFRERKKEGTWKANLPKLILVGLPALFFASNYLYFYSDNFLRNILVKCLEGHTIAVSLWNYLYLAHFTTIFQIILGYVIITSFYKGSEESRLDSEVHM